MNETKLTIVIAAVMGCAGVVMLAAGSHATPGNSTIAGQMLLFHAPAIMAAALARDAGRLHRRAGMFALLAMVVGVSLFCADLALRGLGAGRLFPMAAPIGGSLTIFSWLVLALAAALAPPGRRSP